jgi:predicted RNA-binding Zn-ribbon protein involved in translation (DUF1610 family)
MSSKPSNPKDALGVKKHPFSTVSEVVIAEVGVAMLEGAMKYGRHNYRAIGVRASVYYDACRRHVGAWWEGEDIDDESGIHHLSKAIASLIVIRDAQLRGMCNDDRPPRSEWRKHAKMLNEIVAKLFEKYPKQAEAYTQAMMDSLAFGTGIVQGDERVSPQEFIHYREGDRCPKCGGLIAPPCEECVELRLVCLECGWEPPEE